jgi:hypothetical protein
VSVAEKHTKTVLPVPVATNRARIFTVTPPVSISVVGVVVTVVPYAVPINEQIPELLVEPVYNASIPLEVATLVRIGGARVESHKIKEPQIGVATAVYETCAVKMT